MRREDLAAADCGIAQALGVVGDWWTVLLLREVAGGVTRFDGIQDALGISRRALTERLASLVDHGVLERRAYSDRPPRHDYELTARGEGFLPVLVALQEFGDRHVMGDGSLTATTAATSSEASRVAALLGARVPDVPLLDQSGAALSLRPTSGWRVAFFFPGAYAPQHGYPPAWDRIPGSAGCTLEATTYAARHDDFAAAGADVVGVSTQRPDEQAAFHAHVGLPYPLASDPTGGLGPALRLPVFRAAGVDRFKRQSLLLDPAGVVRHVQLPITDPAGSVEEMLDVVRTLAEVLVSERVLVGVHFQRHFGGPGHLAVAPGELAISDRKARRTVVHAGSVVRIERKRWEPPGTNHWLEVTDGTTTAWATMGRRRCERISALLVDAGFEVVRVG